MGDFLYKARDLDGNLVQGTMAAAAQNEIIEILQRRGLLITSIEQIITRAETKKVTIGGKRKISFSYRVKSDDLCIFARQLGTLLNAGVPLLRSLGVLGKQIESMPLRYAVEKIKDDIQAGSTLRDAIDKHPKVFSRFWVNLVGTGEASGQLPSVLEQIAQYFQSSGELQRRVVSALMYPAILITVSVGAIFVFVIKIVPVFAEMLQGFGMDLPLITRLVIGVSAFMKKFTLPIVVGLPLSIFLLVRIIKTEKGRFVYDRLRLSMPLFGDLFRNIAIANFARGLGTMIASGVPILYALEIVTRTVGNRVVEESLELVKDSVRDGKTIAEPLEASGIFPPMVILMVNVGEETGELSDMLGHIAKFYEERVTLVVERLATLLEPILLVFMGLIVGFLVVAMFLPIFKMAAGVKM